MNSNTENANAYGFAGLAGLVGLFSTMVMNILRRIAVEILGLLQHEEDSVE